MVSEGFACVSSHVTIITITTSVRNWQSALKFQFIEHSNVDEEGSVVEKTGIRKEDPVDQTCNEGMEGRVEERAPRARITHAGTLT